MPVTEEVEENEVLDRLLCAIREHITVTDEASERLDNLHVEEVRGMEVVTVAE